MNELHKAYAVLGLEPGSSMDSIMRRYKRLIMVWHPDRAPTKEHKEFAEEELKKINNAKDLLTKHFNGAHRATGCECQPAGASAKSAAGASAGPGPRYHQSKTAEQKQREDEAARNRDAERKRREQEEAKQKQANQEYQKKQAQQSMQSAMQQQGALKDEKLRWQISIGIIIAFIGLEIFGSCAIGMKDWWHDFTWKWQRDHPSSDSDSKPPDIGTNTGSDTSTTTPTPYDRTPSGNTTTWQQEQDQRDKEQKDREQKQKDQDIYFAKLEVDKYEKAIEHSQTTIAQLEAQIANPEISGVERNKLVDYQNYQRKCLADSQESLKYAQQKLNQLQGNPELATPPIVSPLTGTGIPLVPIPEHKSFFSPTPSTYTSPFALPRNPDTVPNRATSKPMFDLSKLRNTEDPNSLPNSSQSSLDYFSKLKTVPLTPSTPAPQTQTNTSDGSSQSLLDSFNKRRLNQSLQDALKNTGTSTTTSP